MTNSKPLFRLLSVFILCLTLLAAQVQTPLFAQQAATTKPADALVMDPKSGENPIADRRNRLQDGGARFIESPRPGEQAGHGVLGKPPPVISNPVGDVASNFRGSYDAALRVSHR